ncbi:MAG TPA: alpha-glucan family phosphorylase [Candidatus Omnitrophota bacterium]|nr:alpha-glucan family phosphorylase [Candidatus Omnitrophota bacterium]
MQNTQTQLERFLSLVPVDDFDRYAGDITEGQYFGFPMEPILRAEEALRSPSKGSVGYFSMEYGLSTNTYNPLISKNPDREENHSGNHRIFSNLRAMDYYLTLRTNHRLDLPIYSGGLGVLAGDTLKSTADLGISLAGFGILWRKGYFKQNFWFKDGQIPEENRWDPYSYPGLVPLKTHIEIPLKKETIRIRLWKYYVYSLDRQHVVPLVLLDSHVDGNSDFTRQLTSQLYKSDNSEWQILQRTILGIGGMKALDAVGYQMSLYHLNEGHAALAFIEKAKGLSDTEINELKKHFAYTCHTPVAAGHDRYQKKTIQEILPEREMELLKKYGTDPDNGDVVNFTQQAMTTSQYVNAVAQKHGEVTRAQFPHYRDKIDAITNGVHTFTWVSEPFAALFDRYADTIGFWRQNPSLLSNADRLKNDQGFREALWNAHQENKKKLCGLLKSWRMDPNVFTICWARRIAAYKRPSLILQDIARLVEIAKRVGPIQIIFAGKAHPKDNLGFTHVNEMLTAIDQLENHRDILRVLMLENYDTYFGKLLSSSVDVWLNNPLPPFEASGTSGMKAIINGVLQASTLDGWVVEAADKNIGWIFGWRHVPGEPIGDERHLRLMDDSSDLYFTLEKMIALYYQTNRGDSAQIDSEWITKMVSCVSEAGFFNTHRMVSEYREKIWGNAL